MCQRTQAFQLTLFLQQISNAEVEQKLWRLVADDGESATVKYGADLTSRDVGSGFPRHVDKHLSDEEIVCASNNHSTQTHARTYTGGICGSSMELE
jgi:hypothetical protein